MIISTFNINTLKSAGGAKKPLMDEIRENEEEKKKKVKSKVKKRSEIYLLLLRLGQLLLLRRWGWRRRRSLPLVAASPAAIPAETGKTIGFQARQ